MWRSNPFQDHCFISYFPFSAAWVMDWWSQSKSRCLHTSIILPSHGAGKESIQIIRWSRRNNILSTKVKPSVWIMTFRPPRQWKRFLSTAHFTFTLFASSWIQADLRTTTQLKGHKELVELPGHTMNFSQTTQCYHFYLAPQTMLRYQKKFSSNVGGTGAWTLAIEAEITAVTAQRWDIEQPHFVPLW